MPDFESGDRGAEPRSGAIYKETYVQTPVGVIETRPAYIRESGEHNLHGRPFSAVVRLELLRSSIGRAVRETGLAAGSNPAEVSERSETITPVGVLRRIL